MPKKSASKKLQGGGFRGRKLQAAPPKIKEARTVAVSFRLRESEAEALDQKMKASSTTNVDSAGQFARKLALDFLHGRTVYVVGTDRRVDPDVRQNLKVEIDCELSDAQFIQALSAFLGTPQNWNRLRYFMLRAGWPQEFIERYNRAESDEHRLLVVQNLLKNMVKKRFKQLST